MITVAYYNHNRITMSPTGAIDPTERRDDDAVPDLNTHANPIEGTLTAASRRHSARVPMNRNCSAGLSYWTGSPVDFQTILNVIRADVRASGCEPAAPMNSGSVGFVTPARLLAEIVFHRTPGSCRYRLDPHSPPLCWTSPVAKPLAGCPADRPYRREA